MENFLIWVYIVANIVIGLTVTWFVLSPRVKTNSAEILAYFLIFVTSLKDLENIYIGTAPNLAQPAAFHLGVALLFLVRFYHLEIKTRGPHANQHTQNHVHKRLNDR